MTLFFTLAEINKTAEEIFDLGKDRKVWAIHAEMGAGKTTFIHALCKHLGVTSAIGSPTYSIINEYNSEKAGKIFHMDWYRLKNEEEALQAGVEDCLYSGCFCLVEWPERAVALLPDDCLHISLRVINETTREINVSN